jgi:hypothetical protein
MSSPLRVSSADEHGASGRHEGVVSATHPRGMGFRVLSRIARGRADEDTGYVPRHRFEHDVDADALSQR